MGELCKMKIKYTNEIIRKQIKENSIFLSGIIVMIIISLLLVISGPVITYIQRKIQMPLPDEPKNGFGIYYAELTEMPEELGSDYFAAEINGQKLILRFGNDIYRDINDQLRNDGIAEIHGSFNYITNGKDDDSRNAARKIFRSYYLPRTIEEHGYYYFRCINGSLLWESYKIHPVGLVFGITIWILVAMMMHWGGTLNLLKALRPACGKTRYTPEEIDAQANMDDAVWVGGLGICLAPEIMIGTVKGVTAVKYEEIARIGVRRKLHVMEKRDYYTYRVVVRTTNGKRLIFSDTKVIGFRGMDYDLIYKTCLEHEPHIIIEEPNE